MKVTGSTISPARQQRSVDFGFATLLGLFGLLLLWHRAAAFLFPALAVLLAVSVTIEPAAKAGGIDRGRRLRDLAWFGLCTLACTALSAILFLSGDDRLLFFSAVVACLPASALGALLARLRWRLRKTR
jgi:hypothetical protein